MTFTQAAARRTSRIVFRHQDGTEQGGMVGGTLVDTFSVTSHPRYGDTRPRRFHYQDVAEVLYAEARNPVALPEFTRLMGA